MLLTGITLDYLTDGQVQRTASDLTRFLTYWSDERPQKKEAFSGLLGCGKNRENRAAVRAEQCTLFRRWEERPFKETGASLL
jgi:hypothetical protein